MMNNLQTVIGDYPSFLKQIVEEIVEEGFDLSDFVQMDHLNLPTVVYLERKLGITDVRD